MNKSAVATTSYSGFEFCANGGTVESENGFEPHEINGHFLVQRCASAVTTTTQLFHTVAPGRQLLINSMYLSALFASANANMEIRDGSSTGPLRFSMQGGAANTLATAGPSFPTPIIFYTNITVVIVGSATVEWSGMFAGYNKEL